MIGGVPNVGKSTIINSLRKKDTDIEHSKKSGAKTGGVPCVTKSISGFKVISDPPTYITDTPGVMIPHLAGTEQGMKLCAVNCIRDGIVEAELVCDYVLF
jgi:ribosome biogenesis GTPase A